MAPRSGTVGSSGKKRAGSETLVPSAPGESLADAAYRRVKSDVLALRLAPGDLVLAYDLADRFGISRTPMHEALKRLCHDGFLQVYPRVGYVVTPILASDVRDVFELRLVNEGLAAALAAERAAPRDLAGFAALEEKKAARVSAVPRDDAEAPVTYASLNREFHMLIATMSGNRRLAAVIGQLLDEGQRLFFLNSLDPTPLGSTDAHADVVDAITAGDPDAARAAMVAHIRETQQRTLRSLDAG